MDDIKSKDIWEEKFEAETVMVCIDCQFIRPFYEKGSVCPHCDKELTLIDRGIENLVLLLNKLELKTLWSCAGIHTTSDGKLSELIYTSTKAHIAVEASIEQAQWFIRMLPKYFPNIYMILHSQQGEIYNSQTGIAVFLYSLSESKQDIEAFFGDIRHIIKTYPYRFLWRDK